MSKHSLLRRQYQQGDSGPCACKELSQHVEKAFMSGLKRVRSTTTGIWDRHTFMLGLVVERSRLGAKTLTVARPLNLAPLKCYIDCHEAVID